MRRPGRLMRRSPVMTPVLRSPYRSDRRSWCGAFLSSSKSAMNPSFLRIFAISSFMRDGGSSTWSCRAVIALRMRVSISAIGSVITPTPVTSPAGFDHAGNLALVREGAQADPAQAKLAEDRARTAAQPAPAVPPDLELGRLPPLQQQRLFRHPLGPPGRRGRACPVAGRRGLAERQPERPQELARLLVGPRRRHDRDVHAANLVHLVVLDLRKDELLLDPDVHAAAAVERPRRNALEVLDPRQADVEQLVEELVHPLAAQRHLAADRVAGPQLEGRDRRPGPRDHGPLAADRRQLLDGLVEVPLILKRVGDAHVDDDLLDLRDLHDRLVAEALPQRRHDVGLVAFTQPRHGYLSMTSPQWRQTRTLPPSSSTRCPNRTARPHRGHTSIALPAENASSFSTMPPDGIFSLGLVCRFATITASTMIRPVSGRTRSTFPRLPRYLPVITSTVSPRRTCTWVAAITAPPARAR